LHISTAIDNLECDFNFTEKKYQLLLPFFNQNCVLSNQISVQSIDPPQPLLICRPLLTWEQCLFACLLSCCGNGGTQS